MKYTKTDELELAKERALGLMKKAGFPIEAHIDVELDEKLPYMGYTTEKDGVPTIVVSGDALKSGAAVNLFIHELSHVHRTLTNHPSHNYELLTSITVWVMHGSAVEPYQEKILHAILNHLQDIYADDISFKIFNQTAPDQNLSDFFMSWIRMPHKKAKTPEHMWENADALLSTAFASANLERHKVLDKHGKVKKAVENFLASVDKPLAQKFEFFKNFMILMPEEISQKDFERMLISYLSEFLKLTKTA